MGKDIFTQMTSVFVDNPKIKGEPPMEIVNKDGDTTIVHITDPSEEFKNLVANKNMTTLKVAFFISFYYVQSFELVSCFYRNWVAATFS
jgi:hypothetical protein